MTAENKPYSLTGMEDKGVLRASDGRYQSLDKMTDEAKAGMDAELAERPVESAKTAEDVGAERYEAAKAWVSGRYENTKAAMGKAGGFLKRLGLKALAPDVAVSGAVDSAKKQYKHASEAVKTKAQETGNKAGEAWGKVIEKKDMVVNGIRERYDGVVESTKNYRDGVIERIKDANLRAEMADAQKQLDKISAELGGIDQTFKSLASRREALNTTIETVKSRLESL